MFLVRYLFRAKLEGGGVEGGTGVGGVSEREFFLKTAFPFVYKDPLDVAGAASIVVYSYLLSLPDEENNRAVMAAGDV